MSQSGLLDFDVAYPGRHKRWLLFFRAFLVIPHVLVLWFLLIALNLATTVAWWAILITGRYPEGMWSFSMSILQWVARVRAYSIGLRDEYPPFGDGAYPMTFRLAHPGRQARWLLFLRTWLILPHFFCLAFVGFIAGIVQIVAWLSVLILGRMPRGMFSFLVGAERWLFRALMYAYMLTDTYPPFSLGHSPEEPVAQEPAFAGAI